MKLLEKKSWIVTLLSIVLLSDYSFAQTRVKDTVIYNIIRKDTIIHIYRYDTVRIKHYIHSDTVYTASSLDESAKPKKKGLINSAQWGIGPSLGAYYSPFNGFDVNIGFGIQYYILSIPSFRNPHLGHHRKP